MNVIDNHIICSVYIKDVKQMMMVILDQIGQSLGRIQSLETKYDFEFSKEVIVADVNRLTN
jgi:hypothetical protein